MISVSRSLEVARWRECVLLLEKVWVCAVGGFRPNLASKRAELSRKVNGPQQLGKMIFFFEGETQDNMLEGTLS